MADLRVNYGGLSMRNPIVVEPMDPAVAYARIPQVQTDWLMRHVEAGVGGLFIGATRSQRSSPAETRPSLKFLNSRTPGFASREGIFSCGYVDATQFYLDMALDVMSRVKPQLPKDVPLIAQAHVTGHDPKAVEDLVRLCRIFEEAGADGIDLSVGCPISVLAHEHGQGEEDKPNLEMKILSEMGLSFCVGEVAEALSIIMRASKDAVNIPVGPKLPGDIGFPRCVALSKMLKDVGADWVSFIAGPISYAPPNIYDKGKPPWEKVHFPVNPVGAFSGPSNRFLCFKNTSTVSFFVPEIDIRAVGGLVTPEHCVEVIMMGAKVVGLSSGFFMKGRKLIGDALALLNRIMDEQGNRNVEDIRGIGLKYMKPVDADTDFAADKITARVDTSKCSKCGVCSDSYCPVPVKDEDGFPVINENDCQGCGFCMAVCPAGAISIETI